MRTLRRRLPRFGFSISRADVADLMTRLAEDSFSIHKLWGIKLTLLVCQHPSELFACFVARLYLVTSCLRCQTISSSGSNARRLGAQW